MGKEKAQRATFKDLIAKKQQRENDKFAIKDIYVTSMDKTLTFKKPSDDIKMQVIDEMGDGKDFSKMIEAFEKLIYDCCDMLHDTDLHKELDIVDPYETVKVLFDLEDKTEIGEQLMDWINVSKKVDDIKN